MIRTRTPSPSGVVDEDHGKIVYSSRSDGPARLRRPGLPEAAGPEVFELGNVRVDLGRAEVWRSGRLIELSAKEYQLLRHFVTRRGMLLSRQALLEDVWGQRGSTSTRTVDVHVAALRRKLEAHPHQPCYFVTLHGLGYKFMA